MMMMLKEKKIQFLLVNQVLLTMLIIEKTIMKGINVLIVERIFMTMNNMMI